MEAKICSTCGKELSLENFGKAKNNKDGYTGQCKSCRNEVIKKRYKENPNKFNERNKKYREQNTEKIKENSKKYYIENKERIDKRNKEYVKNNFEKVKERKHKHYVENIEKNHEYSKEYRERNAEKVKECQRKYRIENPEKAKESAKRYKSNNKEKVNVSTQKRRAMKRKLIATLTAKQWESIKGRFNDKCAYCGKELPLTQEHFIALSKDGEYTLNNIIPSCGSCNSSKADQDFFEWYPKFRHYSKKREMFILKYLGYNKENKQQLTLII